MVNVDTNISNDGKDVDGNANPITPPSPSSSSPFHSLAELIFGGKGPFGKFAANQKLFRLQECDELQLALEACEKRARRAKARKEKRTAKNNEFPSSGLTNWFPNFSDRDDSSNIIAAEKGEKDIYAKKKKSPPKIEDTKSGKKISRFYDWGLTGRDASGLSATAAAASAIGVGDADTKGGKSGRTTKTAKGVRRKKNSCSMERHAVWACRAIALGCASDLVELRECFRDNLGTTNPEGCHYEDDGGGNDGIERSMCRLEQRIVAQCVLKKEKELKESLEE